MWVHIRVRETMHADDNGEVKGKGGVTNDCEEQQ